MQQRLAMILSIGGVLAAGAAAAVVNAGVLRQDAAPPVTAPAPTSTIAGPILVPTAEPTPTEPPTVPTSVTMATTTAPPTTTAASTTIVAAAPPATIPPAPISVASTTRQSFRLGDAATAVLDTAGGALTIVEVVPQPGWILDRAEQDDATSVDIRLRSSAGDVRFEASLVRGVVVVSLDTDDGSEDVTDDADDDDGGGDDDHSDSGSDDDSDNSGSGSGNSGRGGGDDD